MADIDRVSVLTSCLKVLLLCLIYILVLSFYRLYLHPIAKFPGPKLAALTTRYDFYYEIVLKGQFTFHIQELHKQYGPIIRISPHELHIEDPDYWEELYARSAHRDRYDWMSAQLDTPTSTFATSSHELHRIRRAALAPMFSQQQIHQKVVPVIKQKLDVLCTKIAEHRDKGQVLRLNRAWCAFAGDIITQFAFAKCYGHLESPGFEETFHEAFMAVGRLGPLTRHLPLVKTLMKSMPDWFVVKVQPLMHVLFSMQRDIFNLTQQSVEKTLQNTTEPDPRTVFDQILESDLPLQEKSIDRLHDEAQLLVAAGFETTAWALSVSSFHIINSPHIHSRLRAELLTAIPNPNTISDPLELERLPYLNACTREAVRLSYGVASRMPRLSPKSPMEYKNWTIPPGTPVSMTVVGVHHDESIFPDSHTFKPERWLGMPRTANGSALDRYLVSFGKGGRQCLGINLAQAELHMALATIFRRFSFELYETDTSDVTLAHDFLLPSPKLDSKGVRVRVKTDDL